MKENMTKYEEQLNIDGKFDIDCTLYYNDTDWEINYFFAPVKQDVVLTGTIDEGKLILVTDSCGYCGPMMPALQTLYEHALKA